MIGRKEYTFQEVFGFFHWKTKKLIVDNFSIALWSMLGIVWFIENVGFRNHV